MTPGRERRQRDKLDNLVRRAYEAAKVNGWEDQLKTMSDEQLAIDMHQYDFELNAYSLKKVKEAVTRVRPTFNKT